LPFDVKLTQPALPSMASLTKAQFDAEIEKGLADLQAGKVSTAKDVRERLRKDYSQ